ncbi:MAG: tRNA (adenosine(37)-N6)-threonylcarbamoyltransferase complex ATPase subunit type 1 TsaE [Chromatiales bacterium]|jgi:tRNA threonylcarbamoyladenosine biosynthesis protein TsaE
MNELSIELAGEQAQEQFGRRLAKACQTGLVFYLIGDLGAGKTTLARGFVRGLGYPGNVKSPTYTLVEQYDIDGIHCFHLDLYRLADPEELEYMGMRDYAGDNDIVLIEWPEKGEGMLPQADVQIEIIHKKNARQLLISAMTQKGNNYLKQLDLTEL